MLNSKTWNHLTVSKQMINIKKMKKESSWTYGVKPQFQN